MKGQVAQKDAEKNKKAKASVAQQKQLELLSQHKVATQIAQEEEAQRVSESKAAPSGITGYGKGKALEKHVCTNCLRKGIECEWDEGGQGKSEIYIYLTQTLIGKSCQPCQKQKIRCTLGGSGPLSLKRLCMEEAQTLRPPKKQRTEPAAVIQAPKKPKVYLKVKWNYSFHVQMASLIETLVSEMVK